MFDSLRMAWFGGGLRYFEALLMCGPTFLIGLLIAAVLRFYLGTDGTKRLFGGDSLRALPQSWAVGMLLPVCSIGVLPILFEMHRARIKPGAMSAFALAAPLFNPLSLLYGLTLSRPYVILMFAFGSLLVVTAVGLIWDFLAGEKSTEDVPAKPPAIGVQRLMAMIVYACRMLAGSATGWMLVGALGMFLLAAVIPWGSLQHGVERDDWWAPARMAGVAVPAYATPMLAMGQLGMMFQHANSPGAAFILLVVGAGVNLATLFWFAGKFGFRAVAIWFFALMLIVVSIAYAINRPLIPPGVDPAGHTHAFDIYSSPIHHLDVATGAFAIEKLQEKFTLLEKITVSLVGGAIALGLLFRCIGLDETRFGRNSSPNTVEGMDRIVSPQAVGGTLIAGLVAVSVVMCYAYYPSPEECMKEIRYMRADVITAARSGDADHAKFWIPRWDEWSRRLEVGTFIRRGKVTPYQRMQGYLIRKKLETLEHELDESDVSPQMMRELVADILATDSRWVRAFLGTKRINAPTAAIAEPDETEIQFGPHQGVLVDLEAGGLSVGSRRQHLEILPIRDGEVVLYLLRTQLGVLRPVRQAEPQLSLELRSLGANPNDPATPLTLRWSESDSSYRAVLPIGLREVAEFEAVLNRADDGATQELAAFQLPLASASTSP